MKKVIPSFENSVSVLVKAYFNDTLVMGTCHACAVGNLVQDACGFKFKYIMGTILVWENQYVNWFLSKDTGEHTNQTLAIGYSIQEIRSIEYAFEGWYSRYDGLKEAERKDVFLGLLRVVDVLAEIHGVDLTVKEAAIGEFQKVHATK